MRAVKEHIELREGLRGDPNERFVMQQFLIDQGVITQRNSNGQAVPAPVPSVADEVWTFVSRTTETVRIEDPDDAAVFVDVEKTKSVVVRKPSGGLVTIEFEAPD